MSKLGSLVAVAVVAATGCSSNDGNGGIDGGTCTAGACQAECEGLGFLTGTCFGGMCQCSGRPGADADVDGDEADGGADADPDGTGDVEDIEDVEEEIEVDPCAPPGCGPVELCGETTHGDGIDNDCDTEVDETCDCGTMGTTLECFPGDPTTCPAGEPCRGGCVRGI